MLVFGFFVANFLIDLGKLSEINAHNLLKSVKRKLATKKAKKGQIKIKTAKKEIKQQENSQKRLKAAEKIQPKIAKIKNEEKQQKKLYAFNAISRAAGGFSRRRIISLIS